MPFLYRQTFIFSGESHGWSESLYFQNSSDSVAVAAATVADLRNKRQALLAKQYTLTGQRVALVATDTGVPVTRVTRIDKLNLAGNQAQQGVESNISLQVLMTDSTERNKKLLFLGGVWRDLFPKGNAFDPSVGTWQTSFNAWRSALQQLHMGWRATDVKTTTDILNYVFDPTNGLTTFTLKAPGATWPNNNKPVQVAIEFPLSRSPLDGVQLVTHTSATTCTTAKPRPAQPFTTPGSLTQRTYKFIDLGTVTGTTTSAIEGQNPVSRKRGRPLLVSVGRAPVRTRW